MKNQGRKQSKTAHNVEEQHLDDETFTAAEAENNLATATDTAPIVTDPLIINESFTTEEAENNLAEEYDLTERVVQQYLLHHRLG